jgi:hypothetical protein
MGHGAVVEDRELLGLVLARRDALGDGRILRGIPEETLEHLNLVRFRSYGPIRRCDAGLLDAR